MPKEYLEALRISGKATMEFDGETITIKAPRSLEAGTDKKASNTHQYLEGNLHESNKT
ncbi:hypothetical protein D3C77_807890 [compost metagenome]